ncbi:MAG: DUF2272 domain-containing protein [Thermomicrobiales bacterium]
MPGDRLSDFSARHAHPRARTGRIAGHRLPGRLVSAVVVTSLSAEQRLHGEAMVSTLKVIRSWPTPIHLEDEALLKIADDPAVYCRTNCCYQFDLDAIVTPIEDEQEDVLDFEPEVSIAEVVDPQAVRREAVRLAQRERRRWVGEDGNQSRYDAGASGVLPRRGRTPDSCRQAPGFRLAADILGAVFISWLMRTAGAEGTFRYSSAHQQYIAAAKRNRLRSTAAIHSGRIG